MKDGSFYKTNQLKNNDADCPFYDLAHSRNEPQLLTPEMVYLFTKRSALHVKIHWNDMNPASSSTRAGTTRNPHAEKCTTTASSS